MIMRHATRSPQNARGFTTLVVIAAMMVLAGAVMGMSTLFSHEVARTRAIRAQIQLRQLLIAAIPAAQQELATGGTAARDIQVALPLDDATLALHISPSTGGSEVTARALFKGYKSAETLSFSPNFDLLSAALTETQGE